MRKLARGTVNNRLAALSSMLEYAGLNRPWDPSVSLANDRGSCGHRPQRHPCTRLRRHPQAVGSWPGEVRDQSPPAIEGVFWASPIIAWIGADRHRDAMSVLATHVPGISATDGPGRIQTVIDAVDLVVRPVVSVATPKEIVSRRENYAPARPYLSKGER